MINEIKIAIAQKLKDLFPDCRRYTDDIPQNFKKPAFVIITIDQDYFKRLNTKFRGRIGFDIAYFSDKPKSEVKSDCLLVQDTLLRELDIFGTFKTVNKNARITDNVLHITFDVNYSETKVEPQVFMKTQETNTNI